MSGPRTAHPLRHAENKGHSPGHNPAAWERPLLRIQQARRTGWGLPGWGTVALAALLLAIFLAAYGPAAPPAPAAAIAWKAPSWP